jgi:hypothetical protein
MGDTRSISRREYRANLSTFRKDGGGFYEHTLLGFMAPTTNPKEE